MWQLSFKIVGMKGGSITTIHHLLSVKGDDCPESDHPVELLLTLCSDFELELAEYNTMILHCLKYIVCIE